MCQCNARYRSRGREVGVVAVAFEEAHLEIAIRVQQQI